MPTVPPAAPAPRSPSARTLGEVLANGHEVLVLDGGMGTQLYERGVLYSNCFEELNESRPEVVRQVHEDYLRAGATLIETNTFGANALRLEKHGLQGRVRAINERAVAVARSALDSRTGAFLAGAIGPSGYFLGEASPEDLARVHAALFEQAVALVGAGVDALYVETSYVSPSKLQWPRLGRVELASRSSPRCPSTSSAGWQTAPTRQKSVA